MLVHNDEYNEISKIMSLGKSHHKKSHSARAIIARVPKGMPPPTHKRDHMGPPPFDGTKMTGKPTQKVD